MYKSGNLSGSFWLMIPWKLFMTIFLCGRSEIHIHVRFTSYIHVAWMGLVSDTGSPSSNLQNIPLRWAWGYPSYRWRQRSREIKWLSQILTRVTTWGFKFIFPYWPWVKCSFHYTHPTWTHRSEKLREDWWPPELLWKWVTWDIVTCQVLPAGSHGWGWEEAGGSSSHPKAAIQKKQVLISIFQLLFCFKGRAREPWCVKFGSFRVIESDLFKGGNYDHRMFDSLN